MKVHEFATRLGIPASKIRYYDRNGVISGRRLEKNNYREYDKIDALDIYNALMFRSFDMSVSQTAQINDVCRIKDINNWLSRHILEVQKQITLETMRLDRLQQMKAYFTDIKEGQTKIEKFQLQKNYEVWTFGMEDEPDTKATQIARILAEHLPFSYVALKIPEKSLLEDTCYQVQAGLGILEENRIKCGLDLQGAAFETAGGERLTIWLEKENPFLLTRSDLEPIFKEARRQGVELFGDAMGRMYLSYTAGDHRVHCFALGICFR